VFTILYVVKIIKEQKEGKIMTTFCQTRKPDIDYPCQWEFRLIGTDKEQICRAVSEIICHEHQLAPANSSKGGKYHSMCLQLVVENEESRNSYFRRLRQHPAIKMVI
jgi:putative lipoic acid-binding regulatory protein